MGAQGKNREKLPSDSPGKSHARKTEWPWLDIVEGVKLCTFRDILMRNISIRNGFVDFKSDNQLVDKRYERNDYGGVQS